MVLRSFTVSATVSTVRLVKGPFWKNCHETRKNRDMFATIVAHVIPFMIYLRRLIHGGLRRNRER